MIHPSPPTKLWDFTEEFALLSPPPEVRMGMLCGLYALAGKWHMNERHRRNLEYFKHISFPVSTQS